MVTLCAVHRAIKTKIKGSTSEIADQVGISRSSFYKYVEEISDYGGEVSYSRTSRSFYYKEPFKIKLEIMSDGMSKIFGGNNVSSSKNGRKDFIFDSSLENNLLQ